MSKKDTATAKHKSGYNCTQCLVCAYASDFDVDEKELFRLTEGLGLGMGSMGTCGVVTAMSIIAGLKNSDGGMSEGKTKKETYKIARALTNKFLEKNGTLICRELKGVDSGKPVKPCDELIREGADIIDEFLTE